MGSFLLEKTAMDFVSVSWTRQFPLEAHRGQAPFPREFISIYILVKITEKGGFHQSSRRL
jgi:hypothetical protein